MSDEIDYLGLGLDPNNKGEDVELFEEACIGDDFDTWILANNPKCLPVVQLATYDQVGGWLLREKGPNGTWNPPTPLDSQNEPHARAEAKARIALRGS